MLVGFLLIFIFTVANGQRQNSYVKPTGESQTPNYSGASINEVDKYYQLNNPYNNRFGRPLTDKEEEELLFTDRAYPVVNFKPPLKFKSELSLQGIQSVKIIDARFDSTKVSFYPSDKSFMDKGYFLVGLQLQGKLKGWIQENFVNKAVRLNSIDNTNRQLILLIKKFWFSDHTIEPEHGKKNDLISTLQYQIEVFSSKDANYYPIKIIEGTFSGNFDKGKSYSILSDSLLMHLSMQLLNIPFETIETQKVPLSENKFLSFCERDLKKVENIEQREKGVYDSYENFIANKPMADSIVMISKYTNSGRSVLYACQIAGYQKGEPISGTKAWGYFDGRSIFLNTGNGFYIRLVKRGNDYLFLFLKNMNYDRINGEMQDHILINNATYRSLKIFASKYSLIYKLDFYTGKLQ